MHSIWAVAKNTIKQALRIRIAWVFIILLLVLLPVMGITATGDGTLKGRLQTFVSYGLSLTTFLLSLFTIIASVYSLSSDLQQKQIFTVLTKPIRRFQLLLGKLLGILLLDVALLTCFSVVTYSTVIYMYKFHKASPVELSELENEFFTARKASNPFEADVTREVELAYDKLKEGGDLERIFPGVPRQKIISRLTNQKKLEKRAAGPGQELQWQFNDIKPLGKDQNLFIRFKYNVSVNPPDLQVSGKWIVGDDRQLQTGIFDTRIYSIQQKNLIGAFYEIKVPSNAVAEDGYLGLRFFNDPQFNNTVIIFPIKDGVQVLYKADSFTANFIRASILILLRLVFLACLGIFSATFLTFPVAILLCLSIFFVATISGFVIDSFHTLGQNLSWFYSFTIKPVIQLLPQFEELNPVEFLVFARLLSWSMLAKAALSMVCIKALLLLLLALVIFRYKEIAKITI